MPQSNLLLGKQQTKRKRAPYFILLALVFILVGMWHYFKPLPQGLNWSSKEYIVNESDVELLVDQTYSNQITRQSDQEIFTEVFKHIEHSEQYILLDMFLFNSFGNTDKTSVSQQLVDKLITQKQAHEFMQIDVITDPINTVYGGYANEQLESLRQAGINVIITDLSRLRDSNPIYTSFYRPLASWLGNSPGGWLPHPFGQDLEQVSLRSYLALLNFKANHRKLFLADYQGRLVSIVSSANPHDLSSQHSNVALKITGSFGQSLYLASKSVANLSGGDLAPLPANLKQADGEENSFARAKLLTEKAIKKQLLEMINQAETGDDLKLGMFYLSDRDVIEALLAGAKRQVDIKIILDSNQDAFGYEKNGIPNRVVAWELVNKSLGGIKLRWYKTQGEQFHAKFIYAYDASEDKTELMLGSANYTRRNLENYNLEAVVYLIGDPWLEPFQEIDEQFITMWLNRQGRVYTTEARTYLDGGNWHYWLYRLQEGWGLGSF